MGRIILDKRKCLLCNSTTKPLFRFPKDPRRSSEWIKIIDQEDLLSLPQEYLHNNGRLCALHFKDETFSSSLKTNLIRFAVPHNEATTQQSQQNMEICSSTNVATDISESALELQQNMEASCSFTNEGTSRLFTSTPKVAASTSKIPTLQEALELVALISNDNEDFPSPEKGATYSSKLTPKTQRIRTLQSNLSRCKRKIYMLERSKKTFVETLRSKLTTIQFMFVMAQLKFSDKNKHGRRWSPEEKAMALDIYMSSSGTYNNLRNKFAFPSPSTLRRSIGPVARDVGICPILLRCLKTKTEKMKYQEKFCIMTFDEMSLRNTLSFNAALDFIDGIESVRRNEGNPQLATQAAVVMIRGLTTNWKQIMSYYFRSHTSPEDWFPDTVMSNIDVVQSCGLKVVALVCDQGPLNLALYRFLGVTPDKPYFFRNGQKIFVLFDPPHLIKSVRNNLKNYDIQFKEFGSTDNGKILRASWNDIENFYRLDSLERFKTAPRLTHRHIYAKGLASMRVKLATQVFSYQVAAGLCTYARGNLISSKAVYTADFVGNMDNLYDSVNSKTPISTKKYAAALSENTDHIILWRKCIEWIKSWKFISPNGKIITPACKKGWLLTLNSFIGLWEELKPNINFLLTNRFNQDPLENVFSSVRQRGGFNDNPNCTQFRSAIRAIIVKGFMKRSKSANCEEDSDFNLIDLSKMDPAYVKQLCIENEKEIESEEEVKKIPKITDSEVPAFSEIEENVLSCITGYLAKKFLKKFPCEECHALLVGEKVLNMHNFFLYFKEYENTQIGLHWPTENFFTYMINVSDLFFQNIDDHFYRPNIRKNLCKILETMPLSFFGEHAHREKAEETIVHMFVTMMLKNRVKNMNSANYAPPTKKLKYAKKFMKI